MTYYEVEGCVGDSENPLFLSRPGGYDQWIVIGLQCRGAFTLRQFTPSGIYVYTAQLINSSMKERLIEGESDLMNFLSVGHAQKYFLID